MSKIVESNSTSAFCFLGGAALAQYEDEERKFPRTTALVFVFVFRSWVREGL
jgi:hypothetical protein